jgi:hypothetical protein
MELTYKGGGNPTDYGCGDGYGSHNGDGYGNGYRYGYGVCYGPGDGYGYGNRGHGGGSISVFNGAFPTALVAAGNTFDLVISNVLEEIWGAAYE